MSVRTSRVLLQNIFTRNRPPLSILKSEEANILCRSLRRQANSTCKFSSRGCGEKFQCFRNAHPTVQLERSLHTTHQSTTSVKEEEKRRKHFLDTFNASEAANELQQVHKAGYQDVADLVHLMAEELVDGGRFSDTVSFVKALAVHGVPMMSDTYSLLLSRFVDEQKEQEMVDLVQFMHAKGYRVRGDNYFHILRMASMKGNLEVAEKCVQELFLSEESEVDRGTVYNILLNLCFSTASTAEQTENWNMGLKYFNQMMDEGLDPSDEVVKNLVRFSVECQTMERAEDLIRRTMSKKKRLKYLQYLRQSQHSQDTLTPENHLLSVGR